MLLAIDTSTRSIGVALYDGVRVLAEMIWESQRYHTTELAPAVLEVLTMAGVESAELGAIAVAKGPGSFTALRIGVALAKGFAFSHQIPLIGVPTLDALALAQPVQEVRLAAVLEAGRKRLAVGWYQAHNEKWAFSGELQNLTPEEFADSIREPTLICGELGEALRRRLARKYKNAILTTPANSVRRPSFLAECAWNRWRAGEFDDPAELSPIYLHHGEPIPG